MLESLKRRFGLCVCVIVPWKWMNSPRRKTRRLIYNIKRVFCLNAAALLVSPINIPTRMKLALSWRHERGYFHFLTSTTQPRYVCTVSRRYRHSRPERSSTGVSHCYWAWVGLLPLSLWSVDVVDGRQELLASLLVDVWAETHVHQIGQLLHGVFLEAVDW